MKIIKTPDREYAATIQKAIKKNGGFCLSAMERNADTRCMCKAFREQKEEGCCNCGLYIKTNE